MTTRALRQALVQHETFVRELALVLTRDPAAADDVAQEVLLRSLERSPDAGGGLRAWLASSTRRVAWNLRRSERRRAERERRAARPEALADPTVALAARQQLVDAVLALEEPFRRTIILVHEHGLTPAEIAAREGVPPSTVRTRLHRAHGLLRGQLEARGLGRSALSALAAVGRLSAPRVHLVPAVVGAIALGTVAFVGVFVWSGRAPIEPGRAVTPSAVVLQRAPELTADPETVPRATDEHSASEQTPPMRVAAIEEHPYWKAVRAAREQIARYEHDKDASAALMHIVVDDKDSPFPIGATVPIDLAENAPIVSALRRALASQSELSLRVSDVALQSARKRGLALQRTTRGAATNLHDILQLVVAPAGPGIGWDVVGDTLWIASWKELAVGGMSFEFAVDDLLIEPSEHASPVPYPIFDQAPLLEELLEELHWHLWWSFDRIDISSSERGLVVVHSPRVLRESQAWLDHFRSFRAPLPEQGQPGRTQQMPRSASDERVLRALRSEGGPMHVVPVGGESLMERWRRFGERHDVAVLWTGGASSIDHERANDDRNEPSPELGVQLRFDVIGGAVLVRAVHEPCYAQSLSSAFFDLRRVLTGGVATPAQIASHPALVHMMNAGQTPELKSAHLEELIRKYVASNSWDEDARTNLLMRRNSILRVNQSPWVLDDIEELVDALR